MGSPEALSLSQAPAGAPLYSYSNHTYTGNFGDTPSFEQWGKLVSIKIDVTKPYTGSKPSLDLEALGQFGSFVLNPDGSISRIDPTINLKAAGERYITSTSVTGLQPGDNISAPGPVSFTGSLNAFMGLNGTLADISSDDPSTWPSVSIEIVTDQGYYEHMIEAIGPVALVGSGDFNGNGNGEFAWRGSNASMSAWEYDPAAQTITATNLGAVDPGWTSFASAHFINGASASASQMLMDYVPNGTMTLWWVSSAGQLSGIDLGQRWNSVGMIAAGQFATLGGSGISNFLVSNLMDHHLYDWWIGSNNQLQGIDLGPYWANASLVTTGQFTNNGGTNLLVSNDIDHHLYDWWIGSNGTLQGIDLGPYWNNVAVVANGQFTANGGTNVLVTNTVDHHLYDWWISNGTLQGIDLGPAWSTIQLVTIGRFDNHTGNTQMLVTNTGWPGRRCRYRVHRAPARSNALLRALAFATDSRHRC
jgi:hypothetical protein